MATRALALGPSIDLRHRYFARGAFVSNCLHCDPGATLSPRPSPHPRRAPRSVSRLALLLARFAPSREPPFAFQLAALFGLGWLSAFVACRIERQLLKVSGSDAERFEQFTRGVGGAAMDFSSLSFQVSDAGSAVE